MQILKNQSKKPDNLSEMEHNNMRKLDKRDNDKKIVVTISDKTRKSVIMPMDMYMEVAKKQTSKDQEISWKTVCDIKRKTNYNLGMFRKIFNIGTLGTDKIYGI